MYKNIYKNVLVNRNEQFDIVKDYAKFLKKMKDLKLYIGWVFWR